MIFNSITSFDISQSNNVCFVNHDDYYYPLFDPRIIVTFIEKILIKLTDTEIDELAMYCLYDAISNNYSIDPENKNLFFPVGIIENFENKKILFDYDKGILLLGHSKAIYFVNEHTSSNFKHKNYKYK